MDDAVDPSRQPLRMQAEVTGAGEPLILIGGGLTGWASWEPHAARLSATRKVVRLQLVSVEYGLVDRPLPDGYSIRMESLALAAALDALGLSGPLDLVAWSFGAFVTLDFALGHAQRVRTLTLIEPPALWLLPELGSGDADVRALEQLFQGQAPEVSASDLAGFVNQVGLCPPGQSPEELPQWQFWMTHRRSLRNGLAVFQHTDDHSRLAAFDRPVLLATGTGTAPFLRRIHGALAAALPRARTTEMPAGHAPHIVSQDRFLDELAAFQAGD